MKSFKKIALFSFITFLTLFCFGQQLTQNTYQTRNDQNTQNSWLDVKGVKFSKVRGLKVHDGRNHKNLTLYLMTENTTSAFADKLQTLNEGLKNKNVLVVETSDVNQLSVKNNSKQKNLFINSGDIVKGGKQDRTLVYDLWVPTKTETTLESFCVEAGRWSQRDDENAAYFSSNSYGLSSRKLKIASTIENSQSKVWDKVSEQQEEISVNMSYDVKSEKSKSSLQLTLENKKLKEEISQYEKAFSSFGIEKDAIGFAYAINGELFGINYYNSPILFKKLREKLLTAVFVEAISEKETKSLKRQLSNSEIQKVMDQFIEDDFTQYKLNNSYNLSLKWGMKSGYLIESRIQKDKKNKVGVSDFEYNNWIHRSYLFNPK